MFVGGGVGSTATNTNKSTLIFKGLKSEVNTSGSQSAALELTQISRTADPTSRTLLWIWNINKITLNHADNTSAKFLSAVGGSNPLDLGQVLTSQVHLPVGYGGTGLTGTAGGILAWSDSTTLGTITFRNKGSLLVGQTLQELLQNLL